MRILKQAEPVVCFIALFQSNLKLIDKVCFTCGIIRFVNICADACATSQYLI